MLIWISEDWSMGQGCAWLVLLAGTMIASTAFRRSAGLSSARIARDETFAGMMHR